MKRGTLAQALIFVSVFSFTGFGAESQTVEDQFQNGRWEVSLGSGVIFSPAITGVSRPTVDYTLTEIQVGYMASGVNGDGLLRGNLEVTGDVFAGGIFEGHGNYVSGGTLWLRWNFVPQASRFVPFVQAGAGLTYTDVDRSIEGQSFNFNLNLGAGARYFFKEDWSANLELRYQHISNADLSNHNLGVNGIGPMFSVSHYF